MDSTPLLDAYKSAGRWARAWKGIAKHLSIKLAAAQHRWEEIYQQKYDRIMELEEAARELLDSMFHEPGLTLPPTNSSVDKLREVLKEAI